MYGLRCSGLGDGSVDSFPEYHTIKCASAKDQDHWFQVLANRMDLDFPGDEDEDEDYDDSRGIDVQIAKELADMEIPTPETPK